MSHCGSRDSKNNFYVFSPMPLSAYTRNVVDSPRGGSCFEINIDLKCN